MSDYIEIGHTQKTHGVKGELKVFIEEPFLDVWLNKKRVFLDIKGIKVPYFIHTVRGAYEDIIQFEDIINREMALLLQSRKIFLLSADLPKGFAAEPEPSAMAQLAGYRIEDAQLGIIGAIDEVLEMPQQEIAVLHIDGREVLVPLIAQFILEVNDEKKLLRMDLPDGLLNL